MIVEFEPVLIVLRGLPGAGKSDLARIIAAGNWPVFSIDDYFTDAETGVYSFQFENNHLAYSACRDRTEAAMQAGTRQIILHNTFTLDWELEPYFKLAAHYHYKMHVVTVENYHGSANVHGVSSLQLEKMAAKYKVKLY